MTPSPKKIPNDARLHEFALFAEALLALSLASIVVKLPFRAVSRLMSTRRELHGSDRTMAAAAIRAVERASRRLPWRTVCFHQGLATHWMLRLRGIPSVLHYGIRTDEGALGAHVWVSLDGRILIGEREAETHACVATFPTTEQ